MMLPVHGAQREIGIRFAGGGPAALCCGNSHGKLAPRLRRRVGFFVAQRSFRSMH